MLGASSPPHLNSPVGGPMLKGKTIIVGVTGCIAAYKTAEIVRALKKLNADVWVAMTPEAEKFVTPLTFRTLSGNPVVTDLFNEDLKNIPVPHISLTERADLIVVAPATANIIGKTAQGIADDPLSTIIMSSKAKVMFAPAMNSRMWDNPIVQGNISKLKDLGYEFIGPEKGELACGDVGIGRLAPVEKIVEAAKKELAPIADLKNLRILVTAGATREKIDPVRFISNPSSGKMGFAFASRAIARGAKVTLVSGPTKLEKPEGTKLIPVDDAKNMAKAVFDHFNSNDVLVMAAAVSDYSPKKTSGKKIKKGKKKKMKIELKKTVDILKEVGKKKKGKIVVGFAAETDDLEKNALKKLKDKNLDFIIANDVTKPGAGFDVDTNIVKVINSKGKILDLPKMDKEDVADRVLDQISNLL